MRNNGFILVCNHVESIFGYLARYEKPYGYVKCMKNVNQAWRNRKINPKLLLYESVVESSASPLLATIAAVALAATEATLAMIAYSKC